MASFMYRPKAGRVALSSSLALLLGAGLPYEQLLAQGRRPEDSSVAPGASLKGAPIKDPSGFDLLPPAAAARTPPSQLPGLPEVNGFSMLPASAAAQAAGATARTSDAAPFGAGAPSAAPTSNRINGFDLTPLPDTTG